MRETPGDFVLSQLNRGMSLQFAQAWREAKAHHQMRVSAEARDLCPRSRHVQDRAALHRGAGADGAFVGRRRNYGHSRKPVGCPLSYIRNRSENAGEDLATA